MRLHLLTLLAAVAPFALADVKFTSPGAGASVSPGLISVKWTDSGVAPALADLTPQTLQLMVGGNAQDGSDSQALTTLTLSGGNSATGSIAAAAASALQNGFFLKMTSAANAGGTVYNFSPRFSLIGMTGQTPAQYANAVTALGGTTQGPTTINNVAENAPAAGVPGAAEFTVPYYLQTGLTKYAPMQPVPPTKIVANNPTPLNPTSAFTIATTWLPRASIVTTLTEVQTFSISSMENTAAAQSMPTGDMAKFLARWKD